MFYRKWKHFTNLAWIDVFSVFFKTFWSVNHYTFAGIARGIKVQMVKSIISSIFYKTYRFYKTCRFLLFTESPLFWMQLFLLVWTLWTFRHLNNRAPWQPTEDSSTDLILNQKFRAWISRRRPSKWTWIFFDSNFFCKSRSASAGISPFPYHSSQEHNGVSFALW